MEPRHLLDRQTEKQGRQPTGGAHELLPKLLHDVVEDRNNGELTHCEAQYIEHGPSYHARQYPG